MWLFKKYTLLTEKQKDFRLFCSIIMLMNQKEHLNIKGIKKIINIVWIKNQQ